MKKVLVLLALIMVLSVFTVTATEKITNEEGTLIFDFALPDEICGDVYVVLQEVNTGKKYMAIVQAAAGNKKEMNVSFGEYKVTGSEVRDMLDNELPYEVVAENVIVNPNNVRVNFEGTVVKKQEKISKPTTINAGTMDEHNFIIEDEESEFNNWSITEIKLWYTREANKYLEKMEQDKSKKRFGEDERLFKELPQGLYDCRNGLHGFVSFIEKARLNDSFCTSWSSSQYSYYYSNHLAVYKLNNYTEMHEVQSKMLHFLREYHLKTGKSIKQFFAAEGRHSTWIYIDEMIKNGENPPSRAVKISTEKENPPVATTTEVNLVKPITTETNLEIPTTTEANSSTNSPTIAIPNEQENAKSENGFIKFLKDEWISIIIIVGLLITVVVMRIKAKNQKR